MPSIIDAWLSSSDNITKLGNNLGNADRVASFALYADVNNNADSF